MNQFEATYDEVTRAKSVCPYSDYWSYTHTEKYKYSEWERFSE